MANSTRDAVDRETAWMTSHGDGLPALHVDQGGPFQVVQGYWSRTPNNRQKTLYVQRGGILDTRWAEQRRLDRYEFLLKVWWPVNGTNSARFAEDAQRALDAAIDDILVRVRGPMGDKTHGGRFLSVAEAPEPGAILVRFDDPERNNAGNLTLLRADVTYQAEDQIII